MKEIHNLNEAFGDPSRVSYKVATEELRTVEAPKWTGWKTKLAALQAELQGLEAKGPTAGQASILDPYLDGYAAVVKRLDDLCTQGQTAMDGMSGMLTDTADAYERLDRYNAWLAAEAAKALNRASGP